jgi:hypothetical protein
MPESIRLICFPRDDAAFRRRAAEVLGSLTRDGRGDGELAMEFEDSMRRDFQRCVVRSRHPLAARWPEGSVWYVYRDGSALAGKGATSEERAAGGGESIAEIDRQPPGS